MRTIDADRLKKSFEANTPIAFQDCVPGIHSIIDLEPTVEAIPVTWIEQYGKANWYDFGTQYNAITKMLEEWKGVKKE